jgi:hypothetical protein
MVARARRAGPALLRVRVHLVDSDPDIWRLVEVDADLALPDVHEALQMVMGWENSHLHEFLDFDPLVFSTVTPIMNIPSRRASPPELVVCGEFVSEPSKVPSPRA